MKRIMVLILLLVLVSCSFEKEEPSEVVDFGNESVFHGKIMKYESSKTLEFEGFVNISDSDEKAEIEGEEIFLAPVTVNVVCDSVLRDIFTPELLIESVETEEEKDVWRELIGYELTKATITFVDSEDGEEIAKCYTKEVGDIDFKAYRKYSTSKSLDNAKIGILE